jgi:hypothetical protein
VMTLDDVRRLRHHQWRIDLARIIAAAMGM